MKLPELPRVLQKKEANWTTTIFIPWCKQNAKMSFAWEIKHTHGKEYLNFKEVTTDQINKLLIVRHGVYVRKNPDMGETTDFDGQCLVEEPAYIVIKYSTFFCLIPIDIFVLESKRSKRRSLTASRAKEIATIIV